MLRLRKAEAQLQAYAITSFQLPIFNEVNEEVINAKRHAEFISASIGKETLKQVQGDGPECRFALNESFCSSCHPERSRRIFFVLHPL
ncbi:hypothetical protein [Pedobacter aquatilis]|uniref:hypothetical protein n=1 Tax=Pedobacter aquatilis TaxID=351343 RepID=UPI002931C4E6|nr:hypothetical protein [Pedobacter aquatilis]